MKKFNIYNLILRAAYAAIAFIPIYFIVKALVGLAISYEADVYLIMVVGFFVSPLLYVAFIFVYGFVAGFVDAIVNKRWAQK